MRLLAILLIPVIVAGCGSAGEGTRSSGDEGVQDELRKFEGDFLPSDYDPDPRPPSAGVEQTGEAFTGDQGGGQNVSLEEMAQGFRVQLYSTTIIDSAKARLAAAEAAFPGEWFYLEYDQPTYKIRAGNFLSRYEADRFAKQLTEKGYKEAWTVPQRVFRNPPPPPPRQGPGL